jgi:hypothetical protein
MWRVLSVVVATGCAFVDVLDGEIDDKSNCCAAVTKSRIRACLEKFVQPGRCLEARCDSPLEHVEVYRHDDDTISYSCPDYE